MSADPRRPADDVRKVRVAVQGLLPGDELTPTGRKVLSRPQRRLGIRADQRAVRLRKSDGSGTQVVVWNARTIVTIIRDPLDQSVRRALDFDHAPDPGATKPASRASARRIRYLACG